MHNGLHHQLDDASHRGNTWYSAVVDGSRTSELRRLFFLEETIERMAVEMSHRPRNVTRVDVNVDGVHGIKYLT